ncbi:MAG: hypothetical protein IKW20_05410 [Bacteroidales bacterium]|nr:hypothetical protein [Bacteroidales bacterium]
MKKYAIWNKSDPILTPIGEVLTAKQWIDRYPIAGVPSITVVCADGEINGGFFGTLGQMVEMYTKQGCDFSGCETEEDKLAAIEAFDDARETEQTAKARANAEATAANEELTAVSLASIAASMEYQNLLTLDDEEV